MRADRLATVIVSTDDDETAEVALRFGAQVPFRRPSELALDDTPGIDVVIHALAQMPDYDSVMLLQPTSPLRTTADIDGLIDLVESSGAPAAVSVVEAGQHPLWMYRIMEEGRIEPVIDAPLPARRQDLPPVYALNGALYFARADWLRAHYTFVSSETVAYVMPAERSIDIDTPFDWDVAELFLGRRS